MVDDNGLVIALDGITVQHAGELLFDEAVDSSVRSACMDGYLQSLGDVAFALLCGRKLATSARIPRGTKRIPPAADIVKNTFSDRLIELQGLPVAESILENPDRRQAVEKDIQYLVRAYYSRRATWENFFRRETALYLGYDDTLKHELPREQYVFGAQHYSSKPELQNMVPVEFVDAVLPVVCVAAADRVVCDAAAREFITRVAVTHLLFYWDNEQGAESVVSIGGTRLPHETRALLRMVQARSEMPEAALRDAITPHALKYVLLRSERREDVVKRLQDFYNDRLFRSVRSILLDTLVENASNDPASVRTLRDDMERFVRESTQTPDKLALKGKIDIKIGGIGIGIESEWELTMNRRRYVMRELVDASAGRELRELAAKVFPEFRLHVRS